jgi:hypothetical protein
MMQTRISRPDLRTPDQYQITLDETMLMWLEDGLMKKINDIYASLDAHNECDLSSATGCEVRRNWLTHQYTTVEAARALGYFETDCTEDLAFLHMEQGRLMDTIGQARWLRNNPSSKGMHEVNDAKEQLKRLSGEVAHREAAAAEPTGPMPKLTDELLEQLDKEAAGQASLLDLNGTDNKPAAEGTVHAVVTAVRPVSAQPNSGAQKVTLTPAQAKRVATK